jgi:hypothetical protein
VRDSLPEERNSRLWGPRSSLRNLLQQRERISEFTLSNETETINEYLRLLSREVRCPRLIGFEFRNGNSGGRRHETFQVREVLLESRDLGTDPLVLRELELLYSTSERSKLRIK